MKKETRNNIERWAFFATLSLGMAGGILYLHNAAMNAINKEKSEKAPQAKEIVTDKESVYTHFDSIRDSMWQNHAANMTGFHNELIWKYDSINESNATTAKKNAAIAKAVEEYKQKCEAFHTDFVNKFSDLYDKQCDSIAAVQNKAKTQSR